MLHEVQGWKSMDPDWGYLKDYADHTQVIQLVESFRAEGCDRFQTFAIPDPNEHCADPGYECECLKCNPDV